MSTVIERAHPTELDVVIDTPRGSLVKRADDGRIDYVAPLPCPFNYGSVPDTRSDDGDRLDALVLGPSLPRKSRVRVPVVAVVHFVDAGESDPKYVCSQAPLGRADTLLVIAFFTLYARLKKLLNVLRGKWGTTRYQGLELL